MLNIFLHVNTNYEIRLSAFEYMSSTQRYNKHQFLKMLEIVFQNNILIPTF